MEVIKAFLKGIGQFCKYLFFTPSWGSKHRQAQREYDEQLDAAVRERNR